MIEAPDQPGRLPEPKGSTLADLLVLIVGAALATSLAWYSGSASARLVAGKPSPGWYITFNHAVEACQKGCIALIPLILFRRWRYGGAIRPAEALPMFIGLPQVCFAVSKWRIFGIYYTDPSSSRAVLVHVEAMDLWLDSEIAVGVLAAAIVVVWRRRPLDWITGALIVLAYSLITKAGGFFFQQWANERIVATSQPLNTVILLSTFLVQWPLAAIGYVPVAAAVLDFRRREGPGRTWVEWAGMTLGISLEALYQVRTFVKRSIGPPALFRFDNVTYSTMIVAALAASFLLVRWLGPPCRRFLGAGGPSRPPVSGASG